MSNLLSSLVTSAGALRAFDRALNTIQNNVANASTPGYAKQRQTLIPLLFDPSLGFPGGVLPGKLVSYREAYAERSVRREQEWLGLATQRGETLADIEPLLDVSGEGGVPGAMTKLFQAFSSLAVSPNGLSARQAVLDRAREVASSFRQTSAGLYSASYSVDQQVRSTLEKINALAGQIQSINAQRRNNYESGEAAGPDAQLNAALENLAELVDFTTVEQEDGTTTVLVGGQVPLVMGDRKYELSADFSDGETHVLDAQGTDISDKLERGRLSALLGLKNQTIPGFLSDLDRMAESVADRVNALLADGLNLAGAPPSMNLFTYSDHAAATLAVTDILPEDLAAATSDAPGGNGNALRLAGLASAKEIDGVSFTEFFGGVAGRLGRDLSSAREDEQLHSDLVAQARSLREDLQGVSLDEEAAHLVEFQRAYQASAQLLKVLNELTETVIQLV